MNTINLAKPAVSYRVIDNRTGEYATRTVYKTRASASRAADKLDNAFGAIRYAVVPA
jgi:hypothetical protein